MSQQYLGQISPFSFNFAPKGWALCNGQLLAIQQNQALFSLLGTTYGGDGIRTFALPNLQGSCSISSGSGYTLGQIGGEVNVTLTTLQLPAHSHLPVASTAVGNLTSPINNYPAAAVENPYVSSTNPTVALNSTPTGGGQPHNNMSPYLVVNVCIALVGIFPSRN